MMDYTQFKLDNDDIIKEASYRCMKEMYARAQPPADYDVILSGYKTEQELGKEPTAVGNRHYLSYKEFMYVLEKYIRAYNLEEKFKGHCDIIIEDMQKGCSKDACIPDTKDEYGNCVPGYRGYEAVPPIRESIGEDAANKVREFIEQRKSFYRFDNNEDKFRISISLSDSPTTSSKDVIDYWKSQGVELHIDARDYEEYQFWNEEHGILENDEY